MDNRQIFYKSMIWKILNNPIMSNKSMKNPNSVRKTAIEKPAAEVCLCSDTHTHTHTHTEEQRWISILEQKNRQDEGKRKWKKVISVLFFRNDKLDFFSNFVEFTVAASTIESHWNRTHEIVTMGKSTIIYCWCFQSDQVECGNAAIGRSMGPDSINPLP